MVAGRGVRKVSNGPGKRQQRIRSKLASCGQCFECKVNRTCLKARYGRRDKGKNPG